MPVDWIDLVVIPPRASIGRHVHGNNVEWYVVLAGTGRMWFAGKWCQVLPGDIFVNPRYGEHGLTNDSSTPIHLLVFQMSDAATRLDDTHGGRT
jgi:mannose-6-phosphate isomerase-like protein (cupin superfamily)